ncbi:MAG TPA: hypothetical protein VGD41_14045, partial [Pyrinomonadaceae bacterium]
MNPSDSAARIEWQHSGSALQSQLRRADPETIRKPAWQQDRHAKNVRVDPVADCGGFSFLPVPRFCLDQIYIAGDKAFP